MMRRSITTVVLAAFAAAACSGNSTFVGGDSVRQPEPVPKRVTVQILAGDDLTPLSAAVELDGRWYQTGDEGVLSFEWDEEHRDLTHSLAISAGGFESAKLDLMGYPDKGRVEVRLEPVVLRGRVVSPDKRVLAGVAVSLGDVHVQTDEQGQFTFVRAEAGTLHLTRPAWADLVERWNGVSPDLELMMHPRFVRALRVSGPKAGDAAAWSEVLDLAGSSGINALVVDIKDERGRVLHETSIAAAHSIGAVRPEYDLDRIISDMDAGELYKIARIVVFQDTPLATANPTLAVWDLELESVWRTGVGEAWLDPTDPGAWEYSLELAVEGCRRGFDEIQFDHVSFPFGGSLSAVQFDDFDIVGYDSPEAQQRRIDVVSAFLTEARQRLNPLGCAVAANIFSILLESQTDEGIGQMPESLSTVVDVLSPTIYSHLYPDGWAGFPEPDDHAPEIVGIAVRAGLQRLRGVVIMRPWVQRAFLDPEEILAVQAQVESNDLGWMLWSANADFSIGMRPPAAE